MTNADVAWSGNPSMRKQRFAFLTSAALAVLIAACASAAETAPAVAVQSAGPGDLGFDEIVFIKRKPFSSSHYYTDINDGTSADRFVPENGIYIYNVRTRVERPVVTAANLPGGKGLIGKMSRSFDSKKLVFDFRENPSTGFRVWEVNIDGSALRQITFPASDEIEKAGRWHKGWHTDDIHPAYLQDGRIIFSSSRCEHTILCGGSGGLVAPTLHRCDADGSHIEQLSNSPVSEFCPVVLDDGRVMYHRWEYLDKGARVAKSVWSMNPDGTKTQELYGMADDDTTNYMYPQPLPGKINRFVAVGTCHYPQGGCFGSIMLVDHGMGLRQRGPDPDEPTYVQGDCQYPMINITPDVFVPKRSEPGWAFKTATGKYVMDKEGRQGHLYANPYPVTDRKFLVSYKVNPTDHFKNVPNAYALYLIDTDGHRVPVHADAALSCWHPLPLVARAVPPQIESPRQTQFAEKNQALCIIADVYQGMDGVKPGEVKWLRINEDVPRYWSTTTHWAPEPSSSSWKAALWPRVQWGIVPVETDGSAHFVVPANRNIFFQALDENFREIQRERTYVNYLPGEVRSCSGCHGQASHTTSEMPTKRLALMRPPSTPAPQPCDSKENGGDGRAEQVIHYPTDIQPIFDAKCVSCHGAKNPAGGLPLTGELTEYYNTSYEALAKKKLAGPIISEFQSFGEGDRGNWNGAYLPPRSLGCSKSPLVALLTDAKDPKNAKDNHTKMLTERELAVLCRWVDSNYQFYGSFFGRRHPQWVNKDPKTPAYDPKDFRRKATFEEAIGFLAPAWHR